jgi:hypothetical protein
MKFHLLFYNIHKLNTKGEATKFCNYFKGLYLKVDNICLKKHKLQSDKATNIGRQLWPKAKLWITKMEEGYTYEL